MKLLKKIFKNPAFLFVPFLLALAFFLLDDHPIKAQTTESSPTPELLQTSISPDSPILEPSLPQISGTTEGTDTHFEITDSQYLNITLDSTETVKVRLESIPEMVTMRIESASTATSTSLTFSGFPSNTTFYKYEDDYHNEVAFTTDSQGKYSYTQDISKPHFVFFQPRKSTKFIKDDATGGDCTTIGTWDAATKTCTLTRDLSETIQIDNDGITLDGNNHLNSLDTGVGIYLSGRSNTTIKNFRIARSGGAIFVLSSNRTIITNNNLVGNNRSGGGILIEGSYLNSVIKNRIDVYAFGLSINNSSFTQIFGNHASDNHYAVITGGAHNSTIKHNTFAFSFINGLLLQNSINNQVYNNNFIGNRTQATITGGTNNSFNLEDPIGGNYWDNYDTPVEGCNDANSNGFCDTLLAFSGGQDNLPWNKQNGWIALPDADNDGIPDSHDACPTQAEEINNINDQDGCPETDLNVTVQVYDSRNNKDLKAPRMRKLKNAKVELLSNSDVVEDYTDVNGRITFKDKTSGTYSVRVRLGNSDFGMFYVINTAPVIVEKRNIQISAEPQQSLAIDLSCSNSHPCDPNLLIIPVDVKDRIDDLAISYYHTQQVMDFEKERLGLNRQNLTPSRFPGQELLKLVAFSPKTTRAVYFPMFQDPDCPPLDTKHEIHISEAQSKLDFSGRPMNVEWHETSHELMELALPHIDKVFNIDQAIDATSCKNYSTHAGYENISTQGAWIEGWATFFPLTIWDFYRAKEELEGPADLYRMGGNPERMEENLKAWEGCKISSGELKCPKEQREDFAVASLLWDLYDPEGNNDKAFDRFSDQINLGANEHERMAKLWGIFTNSNYTVVNARNLWDVLKTEKISTGDPDGNSLDFLDDIFIMHGFFRDTGPTANKYDAGEVVAYTCKIPKDCTRPNTPFILGANTNIGVIDQSGNPITNGAVVIETRYSPPRDFMDYTTELSLSDLENGIIYVEPHSEEANPIISVYVITPNGQKSDTLIFEGNVYNQKVDEAAQAGNNIAISHTFTQGKQDQKTVVLLPPTELAATQDFGQVNLNWNYLPSPLVGKFHIYRKVADGAFQKIGESTTNSFNDTNAVTGAVNIYAVSAVSIHGNESDRSNEAFVQTFNFGGFLPPLAASEVFRLNSTIPVIFELKDQAGSLLTSAQAKLILQKISDGLPSGDPIDATPTGGADSGNMFKVIDNRYQLNLDTRNLSPGTWQIKAQVNDGTSHTMEIGLK